MKKVLFLASFLFCGCAAHIKTYEGSEQNINDISSINVVEHIRIISVDMNKKFNCKSSDYILWKDICEITVLPGKHIFEVALDLIKLSEIGALHTTTTYVYSTSSQLLSLDAKPGRFYQIAYTSDVGYYYPYIKEVYPRFDINLLREINDDEIELAIVNHVNNYVIDNEFATASDSYNKVSLLSIGFQTVYSTCSVEAEINKGGFVELFWGADYRFIERARKGYELIGALKKLELMNEACKIFENEKEKISKYMVGSQINGSIEAYKTLKETSLIELDKRLNLYEEDIKQLRIKYIRRNYELFCTK